MLEVVALVVVAAVVLVLVRVVRPEVDVVLEAEEEDDELVVRWLLGVLEEETIARKSWLTHKTPMAAEAIRSRTGMSTTLRFDTLMTTRRTKL